jgi:transposase
VASAVKWLQRWCQERSACPKPRGGSISPLEEFAIEILDLIAQQPDLTLAEAVAELRKRRIKTSRSSLWRFLDRHGITLKKALQSNGSEKMWHGRAAGGYESKLCLILPGWCLSTRPLSARTL